ncbi:auxin-responsive protein IAA2-like [Pyrus ussuriensis x Pyrus communis]|uniref:Auxin-responsive protein n=1 Tax=Pyrus ussuriensis x Pyrus communis TaxID=2448454 RepID=A0A5N5H844_9ROSA|nr:auxin-responsive protein IAA2-like [Pyrus ussuriensis x Pyrus communis]
MDKLYNMICENNEEVVVRANKRGYVAAEDKKLELRLGPPGGEDRQSLLSLGCCNNNNNNNNIPHEAKRVCHEEKKEERKWLANSSSSDPAASASELTNSAAAPDSDQKSRIVHAPVVGWPPIRSSRKNLAIRSSSSSFTNPAADSESPNETSKEGNGKSDSSTYSKHHMFVKINMEGVPIGRKINLKAYDSYEKLSFAIYELFQGLLAAQRVCCDVEKEDKKGETKSKTESLHGNGEYTLLYEDNEGDRMLVGDVPWNMFASTAKRLRVLKSSQPSTLQLSSGQHEKTPLDSTVEVGI